MEEEKEESIRNHKELEIQLSRLDKTVTMGGNVSAKYQDVTNTTDDRIQPRHITLKKEMI